MRLFYEIFYQLGMGLDFELRCFRFMATDQGMTRLENTAKSVAFEALQAAQTVLYNQEQERAVITPENKYNVSMGAW